MSEAVEVVSGPADLRDQRWLDERIETARNGLESVIDIALNWTEGRCVSRLHSGVSAADYVREHVGLLSREAIVPLLTETNWSNRQIAAVAGVGRTQVNEVANELAENGQLDRPAKTLGADGKERRAFRPRLADDFPYIAPPQEIEAEEPIDEAPDRHVWDALVGVMDAIEALSDSDAPYVAATVPERRRAATAKKLRKLGTYLGRIAWTLEGNEGQA